jgi:hypothetical protein
MEYNHGLKTKRRTSYKETGAKQHNWCNKLWMKNNLYEVDSGYALPYI